MKNNKYLPNLKSSTTVFLGILILFVAMAESGHAADHAGESRFKGNIPAKETQFAKVSRDLIQLREQYVQYGALPPAARKADPFTPHTKLIRTAGDYVVVDAIADGDAEALKSDLLGLGARNVSSHRQVVSAFIPIMSLDALNNLGSLRFARPFYAATRVGATTSQGDIAQASDLLRSGSSVDGTGIIVGVLSDSYDCQGGAAAGVASGDLPLGVNVLLEEAGCSSGSDEGRAMLEIVYDVAPGAGLAFHTAFNGMASFANGITELRTTGNADVIVDDVIYFAEPMFQDGIIAQAADAAFAAGVPYFSSAGNDAAASYEGKYTDSGFAGPFGGQTHDFDPGPGVSVLQELYVPVGDGFWMSFQWNQPFASLGGAGAATDMNVYIVGADFETIVASSTNINLGNDAVEVFSFNNNGFLDLDEDLAPDEAFYVLIERRSGPKPDEIKYTLNTFAATIETFATDSGTAYGHTHAAGAASVGAAFYQDTPAFLTDPPLLEDFSSRGNIPVHFDSASNPIVPPALRLKPEITAPDGANTTFFGSPDVESPPDGFPNFFGTSAAAPHAAGIAALLLQLDGTLTPAEIYSALENSAINIGPAGFDFDSGFGLIQADAAAAALANNPPALDPIASQSGSAGGAPLVFALNATDPDGNNISFSQTGMPGFCALTDDNDGTGEVTCTVTATDNGRYAVAITATDDGSPPRAHSQGFYVIGNPNTAPTLAAIGSQSMDDNTTLNIPLSATDADGSVTAFAFPDLPDFCTPTDNGNGTGVVDCVPGYNNTGVYSLAIAAVDDGTPFLNDGESVELTINNVNRDPVLDPIGPQSIDEGVVSVINSSATDPDIPDSITFDSTGEPAFCEGTDNGDGTASLECSPSFDDAGSYEITALVTDDFGGSDSEVFTLTVNNVNRPPVVDFIGNRAIANTDVLVLPVSASDPDGNAVSLTDSNFPAICASPMTDNGDGTGSITCTPGGANNGTYANLTVTATDNGVGALTGSQSFTLVVSDPGAVNNAPVLDAIGNQNTDDTSQLIISLSASDVDIGDVLAFVALDLPAFCSPLVDNGNGTGSINCRPTFGDEGAYPMTVRVSDNGVPVLTDTETFAINVAHVNAPPFADAGPDQNVVPSTLVFLDGAGSTDAEGPIQAYSWRITAVPVDSSISNLDLANSSTASPSFIPDVDGRYGFQLTVTDGDGAIDVDYVIVFVETPKFLFFIDGLNNRISVRDTATGANLGDFTVSLSGQTVNGGTGLTVNPLTNQMFAALVINGDSSTRELVTFDNPFTGVATSVGDLGDAVEGLTFDKFGTLYAVTGDPGNATTPETLHTVDTTTGVMTFEQTLGNGGSGEDIAYNPINDTIYHTSGFGDQIFETVNLDTDDTTNIPYSGDPITAFLVYGLVFDETQNLFIGTMFNNDAASLDYFSLTPSGVVTTITSPLNVSNLLWKGHAFWDPDFQPPITIANDRNGDGKSDILWRNTSTGANWLFLMDGTDISDSIPVNPVNDLLWEIVGTGDYNGDGSADILWRHSTTGENYMFLMNGGNMIGSTAVNPVSDLSWTVVGNGDYDGDGRADILWRNVSTGQNYMYRMNGGNIISHGSVNPVADLDWTVVGNGDYNGDGNADILWRNSTTGQNYMFLMDGRNLISSSAVNPVSDLDWTVVGNGDYNGDGNADILWRNISSGQNYMFLMNGPALLGDGPVQAVSDLNWQVAGNGDYNGDGNADILWRHAVSGENYIHLMNGPNFVGSGKVTTVSDLNWQIVNTQ